ncbi:MAG: class I SAM-dependent methyltransferase [Chitinimonas sp.]|nr:class I SAM-dependent methyltransferase [Chitinimonas sp.]
MSFQDHFSNQSAAYAQFRPHYPASLFTWLAQVVHNTGLAWDVATGNGQAALALAEHFQQVVATEPSAGQLANAPSHPHIVYRQEAAERSSLAAGSADLITVAQALHWFDLDAFMAEADRVLKPGGVLAIWCYEVFATEPAIDAIVADYYHHVVGAYWPPERRWLEQGYASLAMPYPRLPVPELDMVLMWTLDALIGYLGTWSATQRYKEDKQHDPLPALRKQLAPLWGDAPRRVSWPLRLHACQKPA